MRYERKGEARGGEGRGRNRRRGEKSGKGRGEERRGENMEWRIGEEKRE